MITTKLKLIPFKNQSGTVSWRVTGVLHGGRIRKNFSDKMDAQAEKQHLELRALQETAGMREVGTFLSDPQLREAEAAFLRIKNLHQLDGEHQLDTPHHQPRPPHPPRSLSFYLDYALTHYMEPMSSKLLSEALTEYLAQKEVDFGKKRLTRIHLGMIKNHMVKLDSIFPGITVAELTAAKITQYCERGGAAFKTHNNRRNMVSPFLKFAVEKGWIAENQNPIGKVPLYDTAHQRGSAPTISAVQAAELMAFVKTYEEGRLVPYYALCLFAGIRPDVKNGEISKLKATDVHLDTDVIHVEPEISKVGMKRCVTIAPNLQAWLRAYPLDKYPITIPRIREHRAFIAKKFSLTQDVLRHTFISMHIAKFRSMGDTALQAGNSEAIIRKHYLAIKSATEAEAFFNIYPEPRKAGMEDITEAAPETVVNAA